MSKFLFLATVSMVFLSIVSIRAGTDDLGRAKQIAKVVLASDLRGWTIEITTVYLQATSPGIDTYKICYTAYPKFKGARPISNATFVSKYKSNVSCNSSHWECETYKEED